MPHVLVFLGIIFVLIASLKVVAVLYVNSIRFNIPGIAPRLQAEIRALLIYYLIGLTLLGLGFYLIDINGS
jgi:hypothetical protein